MRRTGTAIFLGGASLLILSTLTSCNGGDAVGPARSDQSDAGTLLQQAQAAMWRLDSFQLQMTGVWEGRETTYTVAWQRPDSFYVLSPNLESQTEDDEKTIVDRGLFEAMAIGDAIYMRQCQAEGEGCDPWQEGPRGAMYVPIWAPELEPMWTIELLGLVSDAQIIGEEDVEGVACTRIQGRANIVQAMIQSWQRIEEERGPIYWGEECTGIDSDGGAQEECHDTTLDDYIAMLEDSLREQDENPLPVEVWLGRDDNLMRSLGFPQVLTDEEAPPRSWTFSRFNEVDIKPPE
jgi:hypothetical protein